jgi:helix-turn-helix protein
MHHPLGVHPTATATAAQAGYGGEDGRECQHDGHRRPHPPREQRPDTVRAALLAVRRYGPPQRDQDLLTIAEAAELVRAPVATLRYWRHLGTGPRSFRLGRRVLYRRDDLRTWVTAQRDGGVATDV